jgi:hypothetical protein
MSLDRKPTEKEFENHLAVALRDDPELAQELQLRAMEGWCGTRFGTDELTEDEIVDGFMRLYDEYDKKRGAKGAAFGSGTPESSQFLWGVCAFWFWATSSGMTFVMVKFSASFNLLYLLARVCPAYLLFCLVVTWVWFGGREGKENDKR